MGRSVRKVPASWVHPKKENGDHLPLLDGSWLSDAARWDAANAKWDEGFVDDWDGGWKPKNAHHKETYAEYAGNRPDEANYMPDWPDDERTHYQMYEDTSEGTPVSPPMPTPADLARWLADTGASSFGRSTATYDQWLPICNGGWAPSMVMSGGTLKSGVEAMGEINTQKGPPMIDRLAARFARSRHAIPVTVLVSVVVVALTAYSLIVSP